VEKDFLKPELWEWWSADQENKTTQTENCRIKKMTTKTINWITNYDKATVINWFPHTKLTVHCCSYRFHTVDTDKRCINCVFNCCRWIKLMQQHYKSQFLSFSVHWQRNTVTWFVYSVNFTKLMIYNGNVGNQYYTLHLTTMLLFRLQIQRKLQKCIC